MDLISLLFSLLTSQGDEGTGIDPWGLHSAGGLSAAAGDKGLGVDPNG